MHKALPIIAIITILLTCLFVPGCSKDKRISITSKEHPDCDIRFTEYDKYYSNYRNDAISYIGSDVISEIHTQDSGYDISAYYGLGKLCVTVTDSERKEIISLKTAYTLALDFEGFAIMDDHKLVALASDSSGRGMIANLKQDKTTDFYGLDSSNVAWDIKSFDTGYVVISNHHVATFDKDGKSTGSYMTERVILGASTRGKKLYLVESGTRNAVPEDSIKNDSYYNQLSLKEIELPLMKIKRETAIDYYSNNIEQFEHYGDIELFADGDSKVLLSTSQGIYDIDIAKEQITTIVNTYDYGTYCPTIIVSNNDILKAQLFYSDIDGNDKESFIEIRPSDTPKKKISVSILGELSYESFFQYANRNTNDFYICLDKTVNGRLETRDYIDIISNHSYDLIVFDDGLEKSLINGDYLLNLNNLGINITDLNDGLSDLMEYYIFSEYSVKAYLYNNEVWSKEAIETMSYMESDTKELFADQTVKTIVGEYYGIIQNEIDTNGSLSQDTVLEMLSICTRYNKDYYETESMTSEILKGSMVFNNVDIDSVEELYSYYCYYPHILGFCAPWGYDFMPITPPCYIGICSSSTNINDCVAILNLLLSEDVQKNMSIPVNKNALNYQIDNLIGAINEEKALKILSDYALYSDSEWTAYEEEINKTIGEMMNGTRTEVNQRESVMNVNPLYDKASLEEFRALSTLFFSKNDIIFRFDKTIFDLLIEETNSYLSRQEDINQAAKKICNRINTHVSETRT